MIEYRSSVIHDHGDYNLDWFPRCIARAQGTWRCFTISCSRRSLYVYIDLMFVYAETSIGLIVVVTTRSGAYV